MRKGEATRSIRSKSAKNACSSSERPGCASSRAWRLGTRPASMACRYSAITRSMGPAVSVGLGVGVDMVRSTSGVEVVPQFFEAPAKQRGNGGDGPADPVGDLLQGPALAMFQHNDFPHRFGKLRQGVDQPKQLFIAFGLA